MAPRALARMLAARELSPSAYALLHFVAEYGADWPEGFATTNGFLAGSLGISERTVRRGLQALRDDGLLDYEDHERVAVFTVRTADRLRTLLKPLESAPVSAPVSASAADTPSSTEAPEAASQAGMSAAPSGDSRARARRPRSRSRKDPSGELTPAAPAQKLIAGYVDRLRANGIPVPRRLVGQVAHQVGELVRDGVPAETIARALDLMHERRLNPSTLASLIPEAAAGPGTREHPADQLLREVLEDTAP
jgi:hypothetical protein